MTRKRGLSQEICSTLYWRLVVFVGLGHLVLSFRFTSLLLEKENAKGG